MIGSRFQDRHQAGRLLGERLAALRMPRPLCVLALPRGGVPVGVEVARALQSPVHPLLVRKIGVPWQPELAVAAVVEGDPAFTVVDHALAQRCGITAAYIETKARLEIAEIARRRALYRQGQPLPRLAGQGVVVVDDGLATGTTMRAALKAVRVRLPAWLVLAVPVAPPDTVNALRADVDRLECLLQPSDFCAIGDYYCNFRQLDDDEVTAELAQADAASPARDAP